MQVGKELRLNRNRGYLKGFMDTEVEKSIFAVKTAVSEMKTVSRFRIYCPPPIRFYLKGNVDGGNELLALIRLRY